MGYFILGKRLNGKTIRFPIDNELEVECKQETLIELNLTDKVKYVFCSSNYIKELMSNSNIEILECYNNKIRRIVFPINVTRRDIVRYMDCRHNPVSQDTFLDIHEEMVKIWKENELPEKEYYTWEMFEKAVINISYKIPTEDLKNLKLSKESRDKMRGIIAAGKVGVFESRVKSFKEFTNG